MYLGPSGPDVGGGRVRPYTPSASGIDRIFKGLANTIGLIFPFYYVRHLGFNSSHGWGPVRDRWIERSLLKLFIDELDQVSDLSRVPVTLSDRDDS